MSDKDLTNFGLVNPTGSDKKFITKDSGVHKSFDSGMKRDTASGKPRYDLITPLNCPKDSSMLYRWAMLLERGAQKYGERNWEKANGVQELQRFKESAARHFNQWLNGWDMEEDHGAAVLFNIQGFEWLSNKLAEGDKNEEGRS